MSGRVVCKKQTVVVTTTVRGRTFVACGLLACIALACGGSKHAAKKLGSTGPNTSATGFCADTCNQVCESDDDCKTSDGELCCDFGSDGKACTAAHACPRICEDDARCDSSQGESCLRVTLESTSKVCADLTTALELCPSGDDSQCHGAGESCCTSYREPVCLPPSSCPKSCDANTPCDTASGEVCCATLAQLDKTLKPGALCVDPSAVACPRACTKDGDCEGLPGAACCDGFCSTACSRSCTTSSDCRDQICCRTRAVRSPLFATIRRPGYASPPPPSRCDGYLCGDGTCLQSTARCNGAIECSSGEDEAGCPTPSCSGFSCSDGTCLPASVRCDGRADCARADDELGCSCTGFACAGGSPCLSQFARCDGVRQCPQGDDELGCRTCSGFLCSSGMCVSSFARCDGRKDCPGGEDENGCGCPDGYFGCRGGTCIANSQKCDGKADCPNQEDELGCTMTCPEYTCLGGGRCIANNWRCDGFPDCPQGDDELGCGDAG